MSKKLRDRVALVTGASRGIGKGIALELAAAGATVYITARSVEKRHHIDARFGAQPPGTASEVVDEIEAAGGRAIAVHCDHADDAQTRDVLERIAREQRRLDVVVNNAMASEAAGIALGPPAGGKPFWRVPLEAWDMMTTVGLRSHFATTVFAMPLLTESKGLVVNVSSPGAERYWSSVIMGVEKCGADRMIRDMAYETGPGGVTFVAIWPGFTKTERVETWGEHFVERYRGARRYISDYRGEPEEVTADNMQVESQRFCGMAVVALACDPDVNALSGRTMSTARLALRYGYTDTDGTVPDAFGTLVPGMWTSLESAVSQT